jgi:hypothetical protein
MKQRRIEEISLFKKYSEDSKEGAKETKAAHMVPAILVLMWVFSSS